MAPLAVLRALLLSFAHQPVVLLTRVNREAAHGGRAVDQNDVAGLDLRRGAAIDESALRGLTGPIATDAARQYLRLYRQGKFTV